MKVGLQKNTKIEQAIRMTKAWAIVKSGQCIEQSGEIGTTEQLVCLFSFFL
jgi:hypothetical protein